MTVKTYTYKIAEHFVSAIMNDDWTGLDEADSGQLTSFLAGLPVHFHYKAPMHSIWQIASDYTDDFARCDVSDLHANCATMTLNYL